jgi:putative ABC transport system permease protein
MTSRTGAGTSKLITALVIRPILREKFRTLLTLLGIAVGVAVVVAIELSNQSALRAFRDSVDAVAGRANYQIVSDSGPMSEDVLLRLQPLWQRGVRFAPVIDIEAGILPTQLPVRVLGVDLLSDLHFRNYKYASVLTADAAHATQTRNAATEAQLVSTFFDLFRADSIVLPGTFAHEHGLALGKRVTLEVGGEQREFVVRGILDAHGPATALGGAIAIVDIATAQKSFGLQGRISRVDLIVPDDVAEATLSEISRALPPGARLERPSRRNERVENMLRAFRVNLFALAGVALLVGMFLVYNTVLISILRRRRDVGIFKTLGVAPSQIFFAFLGEGALFGAIGSVAGVLLGNGLAYMILHLIGRTINSLYVRSSPESISLTPGIIAAGLAVGTLLSLLSALQPSAEAASVLPNTLIRAGLQQRVRRTSSRKLAMWALLCFIAAALVSRIPPLHGIAVAGYIAVLIVVIGFSLLSPIIVGTTARLTGRSLRRLFGIVGQLAAASLPASLRRTAIASAALSLATGMMIAVALMVGSFRETVRIWVDQTVSSDLWLRPGRGLASAPAAVFPASIRGELQKLDFVAAYDVIRMRRMAFGDSYIAVGGGDFEVAKTRGTLPMVSSGSASAALARAERDGGVLVSESFSIRYHKDAGDSVTLPTIHGQRSFPISGVYRDYSSDRGIVIMARPLYIDSFGDDTINTVSIWLKPGVNPEEGRARLEKLLGPRYHAFAVTNVEIRRQVMTIFDQTFMITYALLGVAIVIAVLGIVNTLAALILERRRELGLLRVLGMTTAEVRRMIVLESSLLGLASTIVGLVMGYALSWILIFVINKQSFGWTIEFHTPVALIASCSLITFAAATLAGIIPARLAERLDLADAIKV